MLKKGSERIYQGEGFIAYHQNIPKKQLARHQHKEAHLFIPLEGSLELVVEGTLYKVVAGKMMFIPGNIDHSFSTHQQSGERIILQFDENQNSKFRKFKSAATMLATHPLIKELILHLFTYAETSFRLSMEKLILEILQESLVSQNLNSENVLFLTQEKLLKSQNASFHKVSQIMSEQLELSLDEIAAQAGLSKRTLTRLVQDEMGMSGKELYTYFRIQRACELIFQGELGLTAIAFECGYSSLSQFIGNFKRWTGMKPSEFRPSH